MRFIFAFFFCVATLGVVDLEIIWADGYTFKWVGWIRRINQRKKNKDRTKYVEVVRCNKCHYWDNATVNEKGFLICPASGMEITSNDFCSYGERKDNERKAD